MWKGFFNRIADNSPNSRRSNRAGPCKFGRNRKEPFFLSPAGRCRQRFCARCAAALELTTTSMIGADASLGRRITLAFEF